LWIFSVCLVEKTKQTKSQPKTPKLHTKKKQKQNKKEEEGKGKIKQADTNRVHSQLSQPYFPFRFCFVW